MTESQFSKIVRGFLEEGLVRSGFGEVRVAERQNVLISLTVGKIKEAWRLVFGFLEQDIILYRDEMDLKELRNDKVLIPRATKEGKLIIPLAVCELKIGKNINTHQFITYGSIANELRSVFPHCAYYFISQGGERKFAAETLLRHTKEFDKVFLKWEEQKDEILESLISHLKSLKGLGII